MSNKSDENKISAQDEAFVDSLYAELEAENEQPSELLDHRIISAAHKAVSTKYQQETKNNTEIISTVNKIRIKPVWYVSLASAASFILVVSLVITQGDNLNVGFENTMAVPEESQVQKEFSRAATIEKKRLPLTKMKQQQKQKRVLKKSMRTEKAMPMLSFTDAIAVDEKAPEAKNEIDENVLNISIEDSLINEIVILTRDKYESFIEQNQYGYFVNEQPLAYIVNVYNKSDEVIQYQLSKAHFLLKQSNIKEGEKFLFNQFEFITALK